MRFEVIFCPGRNETFSAGRINLCAMGKTRSFFYSSPTTAFFAGQSLMNLKEKYAGEGY
jgi:hypothetical protein